MVKMCVIISVKTRKVYGIHPSKSAAQKNIAEWIRKGNPRAAIAFREDGCYINNEKEFVFEEGQYHS